MSFLRIQATDWLMRSAWSNPLYLSRERVNPGPG